jgi:hypothetical protein
MSPKARTNFSVVGLPVLLSEHAIFDFLQNGFAGWQSVGSPIHL